MKLTMYDDYTCPHSYRAFARLLQIPPSRWAGAHSP